MVSITNGLGSTSRVSYDPINPLTARTDSLGNAERFSYDTMGHPITYVDRNGSSDDFDFGYGYGFLGLKAVQPDSAPETPVARPLAGRSVTPRAVLAKRVTSPT